MVYLQMNNLTKLFHTLVISFFLMAETSIRAEEAPAASEKPTAENSEKTMPKKVVNKMQLQTKQENLNLVLDKTIYDDNSYFQTISSISVPDAEFPMELITIDELTEEKQPWAHFEPGQSITLRSTDSFASYVDVAEESQNEPGNKENKTTCNQHEFLMFATIHHLFPYTGVIQEKNQAPKQQWFEMGNYVCAEIRNEK